jgi:hypothetical protein
MRNNALIEKTPDRALIVLLVLTALYGVLLIFFFPSFHTDDYLVFSYIDAHKAMPVAFDPAADYYLFFRPLSYFFFRIMYHAFGTHAVLMKIPILGIFLLLTYLVYKTLSFINLEYKLHASTALIAFAAFFFVAHPDMMHCIVWISNANELLMVFFYVLALYIFAKTKMATTSSFIAVVLLSLLSLLAKQQSMHFVLLAGLYLFQQADNNNKNESRRAKGIIAAGLFIIVAYTVITNMVVQVNAEVFSYLWKKPFALLGTVIYILIPMGGEKIYQFFVVHKVVAASAAGIGVLLAVVYFIRSANKKNILRLLLMALVIFFPRVLAHGGDRVNSVQVFWFTAALFYVLARYKEKKILIVSATLLLCLNITSSLLCEFDYIASNAAQEKTDRDIISMTHGKESGFLILVAGDTYLLDYSTHYLLTGKFGKTGYQTAPFMVNNMLETSSQTGGRESVRCEITNNEMRLITLQPHAYLSIDNTNPLYSSFKILETRGSDVGRGYSLIRAAIPQDKSALKKIYFDGKKWARL